MQLAVRDFTSLIGGMKTAVQTAAAQAVNLTIGSTLRAMLEASATIGIWFQWLILQVLGQTRFASSFGTDADSWGADFTFYRLPGTYAVGQLTFSRLSPTAQAVITPGTQVLTTGAATTFVVSLDTTQPTWSIALGGYVMSAGTASLTVPAVALVAGTGGNILGGAVTLLGQAMTGVDSVTNALPFTGGVAAESDAAYKTRFQAWVNSRAAGTNLAIYTAAISYQAGLTAVVVENSPQVGFATVIVDDGSGSPSSALLAGVQAAVNAVRPLGSTVAVLGPQVVHASIGIVLNLPGSANRTLVVNEVSAAVSAYAAATPVGAELSYGKLASIVYGADTNVLPGTSILLNGGAADLLALPTQVIRISALSVA